MFVVNLLPAQTTTAYLLPLLQLGQHDDGVTLPLPHHPPEVLHRVLQRALRGNEVVLLPVALSTQETIYIIYWNACKEQKKCSGRRMHQREDLTSIKDALT